jgi:hypothetical protein
VIERIVPRLCFVWNTDAAEEIFRVFDHPNVYIFGRDRALSPDQTRDVIEQSVSP